MTRRRAIALVVALLVVTAAEGVAGVWTAHLLRTNGRADLAGAPHYVVAVPDRRRHRLRRRRGPRDQPTFTSRGLAVPGPRSSHLARRPGGRLRRVRPARRAGSTVARRRGGRVRRRPRVDGLVPAHRDDPVPDPGRALPVPTMARGRSGDRGRRRPRPAVVDPLRAAARRAVPERREPVRGGGTAAGHGHRRRACWSLCSESASSSPRCPSSSASAARGATSGAACSGWSSWWSRCRSSWCLPTSRPTTSSDSITVVATAAFITLVPIAAGLSVLRYRLYDVERIVASTRHLGGAEHASWWRPTASWSGWAPARCRPDPCPQPWRRPLGAVVAAGLAFPLRRAVQDQVDRRFNRRAYDARRVIGAALAAEDAGIDVESVLRDALHDPALTVAYPGPDGGWVRADGPRGSSPAATSTWTGTAGSSRGSASTRTRNDAGHGAPGRGAGRGRARQHPAARRAGPPGRRDRRVAGTAGRRAAAGTAPDRAGPARRRPAVAARAGLRAPVRPAQRRPGADAAGPGRGRRRGAGRGPRAARPGQRAAPRRPDRRRAGRGARRHGPALPRAAAGPGRGRPARPGHGVHRVVGDRRGRGQRAEARRGPRHRGRRAAPRTATCGCECTTTAAVARTPTGPGCAACATGSRRPVAGSRSRSDGDGTTVEAVLPCGS